MPAADCGWQHPWEARGEVADCLGCFYIEPRPAVRYPHGPHNGTVAKFEDYDYLRQSGASHHEALERVGWKQAAFEKACERWPAWAPLSRS